MGFMPRPLYPQIMGTGNVWAAQPFCGEDKKLCPHLGIEPQFSCRPVRSGHPPVSRLLHAENNDIFLSANGRVIEAVSSEFETNFLVFSALALTL